MTKKLKNQWIKALRSGEYKQGKGHLKFRGRYCCLGVLCDLVDPEGWKKNSFCYKDDDETDNLPMNLESELGVDSYEFVVMNDVDGLSFAEIADYIKENV